MNEPSTPRYQYCEFTKNGKDGQFCVRANYEEEFLELLRNFDKLLAARKEMAPQQQEIPHVDPLAAVRTDAEKAAMGTNTVTEAEAKALVSEHYCSEHQKELKHREAPNGKSWWDHRRKTDEGVWQWCSGDGKGWRS